MPITDSLSQVTLDARIQACEGIVFYENTLTDPVNVEKYFPRYTNPGETDAAYALRPKLAIPITSSIIDRMAGFLHSGMSVTAKDPTDQKTLETIISNLDDPENHFRNLLVYELAGGNAADVIGVTEPDSKLITLRTWTGEFIFRNQGGTKLGYEYYEHGGVKLPVIQSDLSENLKGSQVRVTIDDKMYRFEFGKDSSSKDEDFPHDFGFVPATWFFSIDRKPGSLYAKPYPERFDNLVKEFNQTISQASKAIKILQNVWVTNKDIDNESTPIKIAPEYINFLGEDGTLEQAVRALSLTPEWEMMMKLERHISHASGFPQYLFGLEGLGNLESGYALEIITQPLVELMTRVRGSFKPKVEDLLTKAIKAQNILTSGTAGNPVVTATLNEQFIPLEKDKEIARVEKAEERGWIDAEEAKERGRQILGFDDGKNQSQVSDTA